jgi:hypothetical protein
MELLYAKTPPKQIQGKFRQQAVEPAAAGHPA